MRTQTESTQGTRRFRAVLPGAGTGLGLYLLTISGEVMLGASVRWVLIYLGALTVGPWAPLGLSAEGLAWVGATAPLAYSALGLASPGRGRLWRRQLGARQPSEDEAAGLADALALLSSGGPSLREPITYVLDDPLPGAAVRGHTVIVSRGLIESESLAAILAHELGHVESLDGRITEALQRLALWDDPLGPIRAEHGAQARVESDPDPRGGLVWGCARWTLRLAGGGLAQCLLAPLWAWYWRSREFAADAYAASLGQAEDLVRHLTDFAQAFDAPQRHVPFNPSEHPPVALRIERLHGCAPRRGPE